MLQAPIDVIIPVFNAQPTILVALDSVLAQKDAEFRVIVVDDGSTDDSANIIATRAATDDRVVLVRKDNGGIVSALNLGLSQSEAPLVARLDADDICAPDRLARQIRFMHDNPDVVAVSGAHEEITADGTSTGYIFHPSTTDTADFTCAPAKEPQLTQPFFCVRRSALEQVGGYRAFQYAEDTDLYWRLAEVGRLTNMCDVLGQYRMHTGSVSSASVHNGRVMALLSQLAALSAARRATGRDDLPFDAAFSATLPLIDALEQLVDTAVAQLGVTAQEADWLAVAVAGKLMELSGYRPYEITKQDCRFIAAALQRRADLTPENWAELAKMQCATAARMLRQGRIADARTLTAPTHWPEVLARAATNRLYWKKRLP